MTNPNHAGLTSRGPTALAGLTLAALALTGCAAPAPSSAADSGGPVFAHVHGLGVDPADGAIQVASHDGLFQSGPDGLVPAGVPGRDLMGFTVTGPGTYLSSGHPAPGEDLPNPLGLVETRDGGTTWTPLSLTGEVDFHALDVSRGTVFGYDATNGLLRVSTDGGRSFGAPSGPQLAYLSWGPDGVVHGLDTGSTVFTSRDGGSTWQQAGTAPGGRPQAITATDDVLLVATAGGVYRSDDGRTFASVG